MPPTNGSERVSISVVVPVRDDRRIDDLLVSLAAQTDAPKFEVLVALDGSRREPRVPPGITVRLLALPPQGAYAARNAAIRLAQGDLVLLTDSDCVCPPDWLAISFRAFEDPSLTALQGASRAFANSRLSRLIQLEYDRMVDTLIDLIDRGLCHFCNTRNFGIRASVARNLPFP